MLLIHEYMILLPQPGGGGGGVGDYGRGERDVGTIIPGDLYNVGPVYWN